MLNKTSLYVFPLSTPHYSINKMRSSKYTGCFAGWSGETIHRLHGGLRHHALLWEVTLAARLPSARTLDPEDGESSCAWSPPFLPTPGGWKAASHCGRSRASGGSQISLIAF